MIHSTNLFSNEDDVDSFARANHFKSRNQAQWFYNHKNDFVSPLSTYSNLIMRVIDELTRYGGIPVTTSSDGSLNVKYPDSSRFDKIPVDEVFGWLLDYETYGSRNARDEFQYVVEQIYPEYEWYL